MDDRALNLGEKDCGFRAGKVCGSEAGGFATGGSILIFGSAAGVAFMSLEKVGFGWYLKRVSLPALLGFFAGITIGVIIGFMLKTFID